MKENLKERIIFCEPFFKENFNDYINRNQIDLLGDEEFNKYCFFKDLGVLELKKFELFLDTFHHEIRSRNKSSGRTPNLKDKSAIERKIFFERYRMFHFHMIEEDTYDLLEIKGGKKSLKNTNEDGSKKTLEDELLDFCHTSDLYLNYQIKHAENEVLYKVLFICNHPKGVQWDYFKENFEKLDI